MSEVIITCKTVITCNSMLYVHSMLQQQSAKFTAADWQHFIQAHYISACTLDDKEQQFPINRIAYLKAYSVSVLCLNEQQEVDNI